MIVVFDVNETLSDLGPMADRFAEAGVPGELVPLWFASVLRDGIGLSAAGAPAPFAEVAAGVLRPMLAAAAARSPAAAGGRPPAGPQVDTGVEKVLAGFRALPVHPDVPAGVRALRAAGHRLATLSNGATSVAGELLERAGLRDDFERLLSAEDAGAWKPARAAYAHAAAELGAEPGELTLVAVHPWDVDGAARAGLRTAWLDRTGADYPPHLTPPDRRVRTIAELAG